MKEQAYNKEQRERPRPHELNDESNLIDLMKESPTLSYCQSIKWHTTISSPSPQQRLEISDYSLEEFADELALIESFPSGNDDMTPEERYLENRIFSQPDFSSYNLTSTDNEDKVFNPGILVHENLYEVTNEYTDKTVKKNILIQILPLILEDYNPPLSDHELPFHIEIPGSETLLSFSSENEEKVFKPRVFSVLKEFIRSIWNYLIGTLKLSKSLIFLKARWRFFLALIWRGHPCFGCSMIAPDFEASHARGFVLRSLELQSLA
ncbi:hypothetical protein Tco_0873175 [Tanacetum coccineum]